MKRVPALAIAAWGCLAICGAACSVLTDFGGIDDGVRTDAGDSSITVDTPVEAPPDTATDSAAPSDTNDSAPADAIDSTTDSGTPEADATDSGADVTDASDGADPTKHCKDYVPAPLFCADFDSSTALADGWTDYFFAGKVTAVLDGTAFRSASKSALFGSDAMTSSTQSVTNFLDQVFGSAAPTAATVDFDIRLEVSGITGSSSLDYLGITFGTGKNRLAVYLQIDSVGSRLMESYDDGTGTSVYTGHEMSKTLPLSTWSHVKMSVSRGSSCVGTVWVDGVKALDASLKVLSPSTGLELRGGMIWSQGAAIAWHVRYDNSVLGPN